MRRGEHLEGRSDLIAVSCCVACRDTRDPGREGCSTAHSRLSQGREPPPSPPYPPPSPPPTPQGPAGGGEEQAQLPSLRTRPGCLEKEERGLRAQEAVGGGGEGVSESLPTHPEASLAEPPGYFPGTFNRP